MFTGEIMLYPHISAILVACILGAVATDIAVDIAYLN